LEGGVRREREDRVGDEKEKQREAGRGGREDRVGDEKEKQREAGRGGREEGEPRERGERENVKIQTLGMAI
jgi:hypothetical protein